MAAVFVDARELATRLDVSYGTVLTWTRRGRLPHVRDGRGRVLYNLDSVLAALRPTPTPTDTADGRKGVAR